MMHPLMWHPIAKAAALTGLAAVLSLAASVLVLRKTPLRAIV
jgi:hypothetical protein